jgi:transcriptional regulator with XRE-family HTH domain
MDIKETYPHSAENTAIVRILRHRKDDLDMTYEELAELTDMSDRTLKRLLKDVRPFQLGQFIAITRALKLSAPEVMEEAEAEANNAQ